MHTRVAIKVCISAAQTDSNKCSKSKLVMFSLSHLTALNKENPPLSKSLTAITKKSLNDSQIFENPVAM